MTPQDMVDAIDVFLIFTAYILNNILNSYTAAYLKENGSLGITAENVKLLRAAPFLMYILLMPLHLLAREYFL